MICDFILIRWGDPLLPPFQHLALEKPEWRCSGPTWQILGRCYLHYLVIPPIPGHIYEGVIHGPRLNFQHNNPKNYGLQFTWNWPNYSTCVCVSHGEQEWISKYLSNLPKSGKDSMCSLPSCLTPVCPKPSSLCPGDESTYRNEFQIPWKWCSWKHLGLNRIKTQELILSFRESSTELTPVLINSDLEGRAFSFKFRGSHISKDILQSASWTIPAKKTHALPEGT